MSAVAFAGPGYTTYQAKIIKPDGAPLEATGVNFKFTILDPSGSCILFAETYSAVNMTSTGGFVSFSLGSGVKNFPASATTFENVFSNITPAIACDAGGPPTYSPAADDSRKIVMQFQDASGWQTLPAMNINAVPYAMYANDAQKLGGVSATSFVQRNEFATCVGGEAVFYNGTNFSCVPASGGGGAVTSGSVITALGFAPVSSSVVSTVSTYAAGVSSTVFAVSSTVTTLSNSFTSFQSSVAASFAAMSSGPPSFVLGTTGTAPNVSSSGSVHTFNFPLASAAATTSGLISNSDYSLFSTVISKISSSAASIAQVLGYIPAASGTVAASQWASSGTTINYNLGNVGIGTESPEYNFSVSGSAYLAGPVFIGNDPPATGTLDLGPLLGAYSYSSPLFQQQTFNDLSSNYIFGQANVSKLNTFANTSNVFAGRLNNVQVIPGGFFNYTSIYGDYNLIEHSSSGNVSEMNASENLVIKDGPGTVSNLVGVNSRVYTYVGTTVNSFGGKFNSSNQGGTVLNSYGVMIDATAGVVTNNFGLYIGDQSMATASQTFNIFSSGVNANNFFQGKIGGGVTLPTAKLHLAAGTMSLAPLKINAGVLLSSPASGAIEFDGTNLYFTDSTNTRRTIAANSAAGIYDNVSTVANSSGNIALYPNSGNGVVTVSATTASTNYQNGALVVNGGAGVTGNLNVNGAITTASLMSAAGYRADQGTPNNADSSTNGYAFGTDGDTGMFSPGSGGANGTLAFYANNGERMRFNINGAGIGTSNPIVQLQVQKSSVASAAIMIGGAFAGGPRIQTYGLDADPLGYMGLGADMSGGPFENSIYFPVGNSTNGFTTIGSYNGSNFSEKMRITATGRVGVAASSPQATFQVGTPTASGSAFLYAVDPTNPGVIRMTADSTANWIQSGDLLANDSKKDLKFTSINGVTTWMTLQASSGNLGIGITNPQARLHVEGNAPVALFNSGYGNHTVINAAGDGYGGGAAPLYLSGDPVAGQGWKFVRGVADANGTPAEKFYIFGDGGAYFDGNFSIGTTLQSQKLTVNGRGSFGPNSAWGEIFVVGIDAPHNVTGFTAATVGSTNGNLHLEAKNGYDTYINHYTSGTGRVLIATGNNVNGKVGIGTTSPIAKLDVAGMIFPQGGLVRPNFGDSGAAPQWVRLGRWSTHQLGRNALIRMEAGTGYNAVHSQISSAEIRLRTSNGVSVDANGFCAAASVSNRGFYSLVPQLKLVSNAAGCAATEFDVYVFLPTFVGQGNFFSVETDASSTWTNDLAMGVADPGAASASVLDAAVGNAWSGVNYFNNGDTYITAGNLGVNRSDALYTMDISGTLRVTGQAYTNTGNGSFTSLSDARYKDINGQYERGLAEILKIQTIRYHYKKENPLGSDSVNEYVGVTAQNLQQAIPEAVNENTENGNDFLTINTSPVLWTVINAIKQLYTDVSRDIASSNARVEKLELENTELKKENEAVKARLERLEKMISEKTR